MLLGVAFFPLKQLTPRIKIVTEGGGGISFETKIIVPNHKLLPTNGPKRLMLTKAAVFCLYIQKMKR